MLCEWRDSWAKQRIDLDVDRQRLNTLDKALIMVGRADLTDFSEAIDIDDYESGCWEGEEDDSVCVCACVCVCVCVCVCRCVCVCMMLKSQILILLEAVNDI